MLLCHRNCQVFYWDGIAQTFLAVFVRSVELQSVQPVGDGGGALVFAEVKHGRRGAQIADPELRAQENIIHRLRAGAAIFIALRSPPRPHAFLGEAPRVAKSVF